MAERNEICICKRYEEIKAACDAPRSLPAPSETEVLYPFCCQSRLTLLFPTLIRLNFKPFLLSAAIFAGDVTEGRFGFTGFCSTSLICVDRCEKLEKLTYLYLKFFDQFLLKIDLKVNVWEMNALFKIFIN